MDFNINGNIYLVKNNKLNFENDKYETKEYKILKKWLIFMKEPKKINEINRLEKKIDLYLKQKLKGYDYNNLNINKELICDLKIPSIYIRYLDILNNIVEV